MIQIGAVTEAGGYVIENTIYWPGMALHTLLNYTFV
jgi:hypothetical protein